MSAPELAALSPPSPLLSAAAALLAAGARDAVREYWASAPVPRVHVATLTPLDFLRDYVLPSQPVVLLGGVDHWAAIKAWGGGAEGLRRLALRAGGGIRVRANFTPLGRGDALAVAALGGEAGPRLEQVFVKPCELELPLADVVEAILAHAADSTARAPSEPVPCGVPYLSTQNDNLRQEMPGLLADLGGSASVAVASEALGGAVDAVNLWIGARGNVSSTHKDAYENIHTVIAGVKRFCLLPPADVLWLYECDFVAATYVHAKETCARGGCWRVALDADVAVVPWVSVDPEAPDLHRFPLFANASPRTVDVAAGETLYVPPLWYHQVSCVGNDVCVAVNAWRDMNFLSGAFATYQLVAEAARLTTRTTGGEDGRR